MLAVVPQAGTEAGLEPRSHASHPRAVNKGAGVAVGPGTSVPNPFILRAPFPPAGALEIGQALPIHAGRYTCTARNSAGVARKHVVLAVHGKGPGTGGGWTAGGSGRG